MVEENDAVAMAEWEAYWGLPRRLTRFYEEYDTTKLDDVDFLVRKYRGRDDELFRALTEKYGPEPIQKRHTLKTFWKNPKASLCKHARYVESCTESIWAGLEHAAARLDRTVERTSTSVEDHTRLVLETSAEGHTRLVLELPPDGYVDVDALRESLEAMGQLIHNRHQIARGNKTGLLLADPDLDARERRQIEKAKTLRKNSSRDHKRHTENNVAHAAPTAHELSSHHDARKKKETRDEEKRRKQTEETKKKKKKKTKKPLWPCH